MSVIHEALRQARDPKSPKKTTTPVLVRSRASSWVWWAMLFFVLAEGALFLRERNMRLRSEEKMKLAYLELNDGRGAASSEIAELNEKLREALRAKTELARSKQSVEYDNVEKEKQLSVLKKEKHEAEMGRYHLQDEVRLLKAELERARAVPAETPAQ